MGTAWSRWLERDGAFDKTRFVDAHAQRLFYASLKLAVATIERSAADEKALALDADATGDDEDDAALAQLQYVLENWAREVGVLYDRVGDFPLILPLTSELHVPSQDESGSINATSPNEEPQPKSRDELLLKAASSDKLATSDRVYEAMYRVANKMPQDEFLRLVAKYPRAARLFVSQTVEAQLDADTPFRLWTATRQHAKAALHVGKLAYGEDSFVKKMGRLQEMAALFQRAQDSLTATPHERASASFQRVMTEEMIELLDAQNRIENKLGIIHLVGSSVVETVQKLLTLFPIVPSALTTAVSFGEDFHVHPTQFWWCLIKVMGGSSDQWRALLLLSGAVPPPCGYTAIAEALVDAQRTELTAELLASIQSPKERDAVVRFLQAQAPATGEGEGEAYGYAEDEDVPVWCEMTRSFHYLPDQVYY